MASDRPWTAEELEVLRYRCANRRHGGHSLDGPCPFAPCPCWPKDGPWKGTPTTIDPSHPEAYCERCHRPNVVWHAANELWNRVMPEGGIVCPVCFVEAAEAIGIKPASWRLTDREDVFTQNERDYFATMSDRHRQERDAALTNSEGVVVPDSCETCGNATLRRTPDGEGWYCGNTDCRHFGTYRYVIAPPASAPRPGDEGSPFSEGSTPEEVW